jgi:hypothetical protein
MSSAWWTPAVRSFIRSLVQQEKEQEEAILES